MTTTKWLESAGLAVVLFPALLFPALWAERHCPGNADSIRLRFSGRSLIVVPVMLDNTGPFDFVVDTGAQITTIDPQLASELHATHLGTTDVTGVASHSRAAYAQLELLRAGIYSIRQPLVVVQDLKQIRKSDARIRGILGLNFLEHFDLLIDYEHHILCLDETEQMRERVKGERIVLTPPPHADEYLPFTLPISVLIRLSGTADRPLLLELDSGIDVPLLFDSRNQLKRMQIIGTARRGVDCNEVTFAFAVLTPQDMRVGSHSFRQISFVTPIGAGKDIPVKPDVDGVLPTNLFRSVFISYADHFAVLEPRDTFILTGAFQE